MQQLHRNLVEEVAELTESMSETELEETWRLLTGRVEDRLPEGRWIDLAARTAADHAGARTRSRSARSFLKIVGEWRRLVDRLAGEPRRVVDFDQLADSSLRQARIAGEALATIWQEELLTSPEVARRLGAKPSNRQKVNGLRRRSILLGLPRDGGKRYLFPAFQIDPARQEIHPEVKEVNQLLDAAADPWGVASWWVSADGGLGSRPMDAVGTPEAAAMIQAAESLIEPIG